jgi:EAL domain-containing protein (putative c-di-GMP-specific phosphodiesterase class I)
MIADGDRLEVAVRIRRACEDGELETMFQPLIELESSDCIAYEALARFPDEPDWTTSEWFAAANALGVGLMLELAAIAAALRHLREIPPSAALAINVSPHVAVTHEFFALAAPFASRLIIELTEHAPVHDYKALAEGLRDLRRLGAGIAIDDVSAGFASFLEGIESETEVTLLRQLDVHRGQGYLLGYPTQLEAQLN